MTTTAPTKSEASQHGITCRGCNLRLPLRASQADETASLWECAQCRSPFAGILLADGLRTMARRVRLADVHFDSAGGRQLSPELRQFVRELNAAQRPRSGQFEEVRRGVRVPQELDVVVVGIDASGSGAGQQMAAMVANLSSQGMLLLSELSLQSEWIVVRLTMERQWLQVAGRVVWSRELERGFYGAGVEFVARLAGVAAQ